MRSRFRTLRGILRITFIRSGIECRQAVIFHHRCARLRYRWLKAVIERRLSRCKLELHPEKTKTVYTNYYGQFYKSALYPIFDQLNCSLKRWAMRKYNRLRGCKRRAYHWLGCIARRQPGLFAHWRLGLRPAAGW